MQDILHETPFCEHGEKNVITAFGVTELFPCKIKWYGDLINSRMKLIFLSERYPTPHYELHRTPTWWNDKDEFRSVQIWTGTKCSS